eukprot:4346522-Amphidinium_carterae.2
MYVRHGGFGPNPRSWRNSKNIADKENIGQVCQLDSGLGRLELNLMTGHGSSTTARVGGCLRGLPPCWQQEGFWKCSQKNVPTKTLNRSTTMTRRALIQL